MSEQLKEVTNSENSTQIDSSQIYSDTYKLYDYFKLHPSICLACISGCIAICSFIINCLVFKQTQKELSYWNVDSALISSSSKQMLFSFTFTIIYFMIIPFINFFIKDVYIAYIPLSVRIKNLKVKNKFFKKRLKVCKKNCNNKDDKYEIIDLYSELKDIEKYTKQLKWDLLKILFKNIVLAYILTVISITLLISSNRTNNTKENILTLNIASVLVIVLYCIVNYCLFHKVFKKIDKEDNYYPQFPSTKIFNIGIKSVFSDLNIFACIMSVFVSIILTFLFGTASTDYVKKQKEFKTISVDNKEYVAVYTDSKNMVLEEVSINNNNAVVYINKQRVVPSDKYEFEIVKFNNVVRSNGK